MTEEQQEFIWRCLSYRNSNIAVTVTNAVSLGCKDFQFEPCKDFMGTRASSMYTGSICYKIPKERFPIKIYIPREVGHLSEEFSVTSEEIMQLVALYEL